MELLGPIIGAVLSSALPKLYSAIGKQIENLRYQADVRSIESELRYVKAATEDYRKGGYHMRSSNVLRAWIVDLRLLAYDIEDLVDRHGAKKVNHRQLVAEIKELNTSAKNIKERLDRYIIPGQAGHEVVGMDNPLRDLTTLLRESESPTEGKLKVISIVGIGGIGKTTHLAQQVYNDVHREYPLHAFVNAGGKDKEEILREILEKLPEQDVKGKSASTSMGFLLLDQVHVLWAKMMIFFWISLFFLLGFLGLTRAVSQQTRAVSQHRNDVETQLKLRLGTKRYLIVIDGVRTEQLGCDVISDFPQEEGVDSRIIVATTIQSVAKACSCGDGHAHKMRPLEDDESEEQFFNIFSFNGSPSEAMKKIRKHVLVNNYKSLCSGLQCRLLYLCMFPSDHHIRRGPLIRRWLAEGPGIGCSDALENFETLIDRNLILPINENVKKCQLPGRTFQYITDISNYEKFMMLSCGDGNPQDIRRLSLHPPDDMRVLQQDLSRLRTLAVFYEGQEGRLDFANCELLRVLDLGACNCVNESHLQRICELLHLLKYLSLRARESVITEVPPGITELKRLETLDLGKETEVTVPVGVIKLPRLKHLLGKFKLGDYKWDERLKKFKLRKGYSSDKNLIKFLEEESMLETLAGFVTINGQGFPQLMRHMNRLTKVKIWCVSDANAGIWTPLSEAIENFLRRSCRRLEVPHSLSIDFQFQQESETFPDFRWAPDCRGSLFSLKLRGHGSLTQIPAFVNSVGTITELCISSTTLIFGDAVLRGLRKLCVLEYLKLEAPSIEGPVVIGPEQGSTEEGPVVIGPEQGSTEEGQLKSLKRMCLVAKETLPCITIQPGALQSIVSLHLIWQGLDGRLPEGIKENWEEAAKGHPNRPQVLCTAP